MPAIVLGEEEPLAGAVSELDLLARAAAGDSTAFGMLIALHEPRIRRLAYRLLGWRGQAADLDDVVQDVFVRLLEKLGTFRGEANVATWLTRVTINRCRSLQRRQWVHERWKRLRGRVERSYEATAASDDDDVSVRVRAAVASLSQRDREVIVLFHLERRPTVEIAQMLGASTNAIDVRLHRARQRLKALLTDLFDEA
jgi:RNA polymerase sigma-70 factor (ECF subfamily)